MLLKPFKARLPLLLNRWLHLQLNARISGHQPVSFASSTINLDMRKVIVLIDYDGAIHVEDQATSPVSVARETKEGKINWASDVPNNCKPFV